MQSETIARREGQSLDGDLIRARVALFGKVVFLLSVVGTAIQVASFALNGDWDAAFGPTGQLSIVMTLLSGGLWAAGQHARSARGAYTAEAVFLCTNSVLASIMGRYLNQDIFPEFVTPLDETVRQAAFGVLAEAVQRYSAIIMVVASTQTMVLRAALVPSRPWHTILLTSAIGVPMMVVLGWGISPVEADLALRQSVDNSSKASMTAMIGIWWALTVATCAIISAIIYRLRTEVREARKLGQYELVEKLGEGGMGQVFRAKHAMMRRPTAIKLLAEDATRASALARFEREVQLTASLTHPNTITIFDYGRTPDGVFYYAMELLDGASVQEVVDVDGAQPPGRVLRIMGMVAGALAEAHRVGLVHRDIKPANILLCEQGGEPDVAKVVDFGLVKKVASDDDPRVSKEGSLVGTPQYMAPESIRAPDKVDARADLYALGAVAYFMLTGKPVFDGETVLELCGHHMLTEPTPPSQRGHRTIPADLEALVLSCLQKDPSARPASATQLLEAVRACSDVEPWTEDDARSWWNRMMPTIRAARTTESLVGRTVAVR